MSIVVARFVSVINQTKESGWFGFCPHDCFSLARGRLNVVVANSFDANLTELATVILTVTNNGRAALPPVKGITQQLVGSDRRERPSSNSARRRLNVIEHWHPHS